MRLFLQKNNKTKDTQPDFRLSIIPENDNGEFLEIGAFWEAKSGKGYTGKLNDGYELKETQGAQQQAPQEEAIEYPSEEDEDIDLNSVPF